MTDIELIKNWLASSRHYQVGYEIYRRLGDNEFLKTVLLDEDDWNKDELTEQLTELLNKLKLSATKQLAVADKEQLKQLLNNELKAPSDRSDAPEQVKAAIRRRKFLYAQGRDAHSKTKVLNKNKDAESKEERKILCHLILDSFDEIKELWDLTNFYDSYLKLPENTENNAINFEHLDMATLNQNWLTDYKYIHKNKGNAKLKDKVNQRIIDCQKREKILRLKDAFFHTGLSLPTIIE